MVVVMEVKGENLSEDHNSVKTIKAKAARKEMIRRLEMGKKIVENSL